MGPSACRVLRSAQYRSPGVQEAVTGSFLWRAGVLIHLFFTAPSDWPLHLYPTPNYSPGYSSPLIQWLRQMGAAGRCLSLDGDENLGDASRVREHEGLTGVKHRRSVNAPLHKKCKNCVSQSAGAAVICVWDRFSGTVPPSSYQQRACVILASGDRDSRSPRSQVDCREARPHLCAPAQASMTALTHPPPLTYQPPSITTASPSQRRGLPLLPSPRSDWSPYPSCPK